MSLLVVGSIALDTIETPFGRIEDALGGSATYFGLAASLLTPVRLVGVVGNDFPPQHVEMLKRRRIDTTGLVVAEGGTFPWKGRYEGDMSAAETLEVALNVFGTFDPRIPPEYEDTRYVFLANGSPRVQRAVRSQLPQADFVVCDTMNYWIDNAPDELKALFGEVDGVVLNDAEARMLTGRDVLMDAAAEILDMGPGLVIIKKGEHGAMLCGDGQVVALPAYPTSDVKDPTGAGDSFAGGFMGRIAATGDRSAAGLKSALGYATVVASIAVEGLGTKALAAATPEDIDKRLDGFREMLAL
ncbi:MAG: sugar kinase [Planctomycetes bacterium]|nr:sugar kinase [Planctomycetota bacterium]